MPLAMFSIHCSNSYCQSIFVWIPLLPDLSSQELRSSASVKQAQILNYSENLRPVVKWIPWIADQCCHNHQNWEKVTGSNFLRLGFSVLVILQPVIPLPYCMYCVQLRKYKIITYIPDEWTLYWKRQRGNLWQLWTKIYKKWESTIETLYAE